VVALQNSVHVYTFSKTPERLSVFETADNPAGLCCLSTKALAFPGRTAGQVQVLEIDTSNVSIIPAHASSLKAMDISPDGEIIATASETVSDRRMARMGNFTLSNMKQGTLVRVFATSNCARIAELRRGVDHAAIFSLKFSPSSQLLAVTSDKSTLHIFDIPHPTKPPPSSAAGGTGRTTPLGGSTSPVTADDPSTQKWGLLGRIPLLPRVFSDVYSFASAHFEMGEEPLPGGSGAIKSNRADILDSPRRSPKGIIGWTNDNSIIVIGAGSDGRWEKFVIAEGEDGKRYCVRDGWKRYLASR
jgi:hypothetical protein